MNTARNDLNGSKRNGPLANPASWPVQLFMFAKNVAKHPNMIGWMLPSSPFVVDEVLKQIDWQTARGIVEYGPGVGTFTHEILRRMHPDAKLVVFETNDEFYKYLTRSIHDPRCHLLHES